MSEFNVNFGCGGNIIPGWDNHDIDVDITKPLPYADGTVDKILAEHVMEHVQCSQALNFLCECRRILKLGGVVRICCPIVGPHLAKWLAIDLTVNHEHKILLDEHLMRTLFWMAGFDLEKTVRTDRKPIDGHWRAIGYERDDAETCRMEATK